LMETFLECGADPNSRIQSSAGNISISTCPVRFSRCNKKTCGFVEERGGHASLYDLVDFWQLENAEKLRELLSHKPTTQPEASDLETVDSDTADLDRAELDTENSEQECEPKDQEPEQEAQTIAGEAEIPEILLTSISESPSEEEIGAQVTTISGPNDLRIRLSLITKSPLATFTFGEYTAQ